MCGLEDKNHGDLFYVIYEKGIEIWGKSKSENMANDG